MPTKLTNHVKTSKVNHIASFAQNVPYFNLLSLTTFFLYGVTSLKTSFVSFCKVNKSRNSRKLSNAIVILRNFYF